MIQTLTDAFMGLNIDTESIFKQQHYFRELLININKGVVFD